MRNAFLGMVFFLGSISLRVASERSQTPDTPWATISTSHYRIFLSAGADGSLSDLRRLTRRLLAWSGSGRGRTESQARPPYLVLQS